MKKISWGILSTAKIARHKIIPALQKSHNSEVVAVASRQLEKAQNTANELSISKAYGNYEELLADENIDAIYIPLPNHLHITWTIKAMEAGKHILCEKPVAMNMEEAIQLQKTASEYPDLKVMEAFMFRFHPLITKTKEVLNSGRSGNVHSIQSMFSYYNDNPKDIRNRAAFGGGGLMDIGCYCISASRFLFAEEPVSVMGNMGIDTEFSTDWLTSGLMKFPSGQATFLCSTKMSHRQYMLISGAKGHIEVENPFNPPIGEPTKIKVITESETEEINVSEADQYQLQCEAFSKAILQDKTVPTPLEDAVKNMRVIDAIRESSKSGKHSILKNE